MVKKEERRLAEITRYVTVALALNREYSHDNWIWQIRDCLIQIQSQSQI